MPFNTLGFMIVLLDFIYYIMHHFMENFKYAENEQKASEYNP